jgi:hypothetical protein
MYILNNTIKRPNTRGCNIKIIFIIPLFEITQT